jgi:hypothetical protein
MSIFFYGFPEPAIWYESKEIPCLFSVRPIPGSGGKEGIRFMTKLFYEIPVTTVTELKQVSMICTSDPLSGAGPSANWFGGEESM